MELAAPTKKSLSANCGRRAALPGAGADETIFLVDEVTRKRTSAPITPDQTTGFDHVSGGNRRLPMKHLIVSGIAAVTLLVAATTMLWSQSPSTERHAAATVIGQCKNFYSLTGAKASELLPY